eukprot:TRINITY_DN2117_c0_g1_i1.p1 TRINITY_DN2117_c0_g1~~TRINITY_DN2117_c0_g1_i1.p1  ORF type:complete len:569 (+),score=92.14 TRINITY_DN2117_c0_g1_i1:148-1707(+)
MTELRQYLDELNQSLHDDSTLYPKELPILRVLGEWHSSKFKYGHYLNDLHDEEDIWISLSNSKRHDMPVIRTFESFGTVYREAIQTTYFDLPKKNQPIEKLVNSTNKIFLDEMIHYLNWSPYILDELMFLMVKDRKRNDISFFLRLVQLSQSLMFFLFFRLFDLAKNNYLCRVIFKVLRFIFPNVLSCYVGMIISILKQPIAIIPNESFTDLEGPLKQSKSNYEVLKRYLVIGMNFALGILAFVNYFALQKYLELMGQGVLAMINFFTSNILNIANLFPSNPFFITIFKPWVVSLNTVLLALQPFLIRYVHFITRLVLIVSLTGLNHALALFIDLLLLPLTPLKVISLALGFSHTNVIKIIKSLVYSSTGNQYISTLNNEQVMQFQDRFSTSHRFLSTLLLVFFIIFDLALIYSHFMLACIYVLLDYLIVSPRIFNIIFSQLCIIPSWVLIGNINILAKKTKLTTYKNSSLRIIAKKKSIDVQNPIPAIVDILRPQGIIRFLFWGEYPKFIAETGNLES